jgi:hypothetical protein
MVVKVNKLIQREGPVCMGIIETNESVDIWLLSASGVIDKSIPIKSNCQLLILTRKIM